ncbi:hypothetical protein NADFUDRAFT_51257 [Nadsonia fulvescens var. elongata DSM 6958]|uniref:EGF-like domain-containing protein n=1 Tax=Nadsonia fulvescens var. elongata DSM 6958 TaxID=857566 RepID=A0A1E3PKM1_9ASCO|nr:hypothetical protein NADFUDRAFT_51257 [Nadsonia fulvescens var. elongata DSM 6958]
MKFGIITALLSVTSLATALSSPSSSCSPVPIYTFPSTVGVLYDSEDSISSHLAEAVIAETLQASKYYSLHEGFPSDRSGQLLPATENMFGEKTTTKVVILNGVDDLKAIHPLARPSISIDNQFSFNQIDRLRRNVLKANSLVLNSLDDLIEASESKNYLANIAKVDQDSFEIIASLIAAASPNSRLVIVTIPASACSANQRDEKVDSQTENLFTIQARDSNKEDNLFASNAFSPSSLSKIFASKEICEDSTNSCSSHGACIGSKSKFVCKCKSGFAGFACQKKDVSVQFQLFFWTGLAIIAVIVSGVSLLASIGSEPLPGVLGKSDM